MGKYLELRHKLKKYELEPSYQKRVSAWLAQFLGENPEDANVNALARQFATRKALKDNIEAQLAQVNLELEALSQALVERFEVGSMEKIKLSGGPTVYLQDSPYPSVVNREQVVEWARAEMPEILTVNYQTLKGICNDRSLDGQPPPPGVELFIKTQARISNK